MGEQDLEIIVNARSRTVSTKELTFEQVVSLAYPNPPTGDGVIITVSYKRGEGNKPDGTLVEGDTVKVKKGMIFDVTPTSRS